jgi:hypothetical protein
MNVAYWYCYGERRMIKSHIQSAHFFMHHFTFLPISSVSFKVLGFGTLELGSLVQQLSK